MKTKNDTDFYYGLQEERISHLEAEVFLWRRGLDPRIDVMTLDALYQFFLRQKRPDITPSEPPEQ